MRAIGAHKAGVITFKADRSLLDALEGIENRSKFIRSALLAALDNTCPLCKGSGLLTPNQKRHWAAFSASHDLSRCDDCHEVHLICHNERGTPVHRKRRPIRTRSHHGFRRSPA